MAPSTKRYFRDSSPGPNTSRPGLTRVAMVRCVANRLCRFLAFQLRAHDDFKKAIEEADDESK